MAQPDKVRYILLSEKRYEENGLELSYVLKPGTSLKNILVVVFSGFIPKDSNIKYPFNYIRSLQDFEANLLFISDSYGPRGCYYLGKEMSFDFEVLVTNLIEKVRADLNVLKKDVICTGSSKGGSAALYFGLKNGYGSVLAGAPQTRIASYILTEDEPTYRFMFGDPSEEMTKKGDRIITDLLNEVSDTRITLIASPRDYQYADQVEPFIRDLKKLDLDHRLIIDGMAISHGDIGVYFKNHLPRLLLELIHDRVRQKMEIHLNDLLKPMDDVKSKNYTRFSRTLSLVPEDKFYLVLFDGYFDKPVVNANLMRTAQLIKGYSKMTMSMEVGLDGPISVTYFTMQFNGDDKVAKDTRVFEINPSTQGSPVECDFTVPIHPNAESFKVAIRFLSKKNALISILNPKIILI